MKRLFLTALVCFLFLTIYVHLEKRSEEKPDAEKPDAAAILELQKLLDSISYRSWEFQEDVFDCSNESAFLYDFLTGHDYKCEIVMGFNWRILPGHSWVIAKKGGKKFWIESTKKKIVPLASFGTYIIRLHFSSLGKLQDFYNRIGFPHEWDY